MSLLAIITLCLHLFVGIEASSFATYSDSTCSATNVLQNLAANNAYPAGSCTKLESATSESYSGFQFLTLDSGCMSKSPHTGHLLEALLVELSTNSIGTVTIYQADTTLQPCSGYAVLGSVNTCYNTSWAYYSVDNCDIPALLSIALTASKTSTRTAATEAATAASTTSAAASGGVNLNGGDVAGIVIGCIAGTALILAGIWFLMRKRAVTGQNPVPVAAAQKFQGSAPPTEYSSSYVQTPQTSEVHGHGFVEAPFGSYSAELNGQVAPRELPSQRY